MPDNLRIGLLDNCCHSLKRGYQLWKQGQDTGNPWLLKEAVMWVHHGIELGLKQLLVQRNEFLVFEKPDEAVASLLRLRKRSKNETLSVLDLMASDEHITTVGMNRLIPRAVVMLGLSELSEGAPLRTRLDNLTRYRNRLVHFSIELPPSEVASLLSEVLEPLLELLQREIGNEDFVKTCIPDIRKRAIPVTNAVAANRREAVARIVRLMKYFNGQEVSGHLFGLWQISSITLPAFTEIVAEGWRDAGFDIVASGPAQQWLVQVKFTVGLRSIWFSKANTVGEGKKIWLVVFMSGVGTGHPNVYFSFLDQIQALEEILVVS